MIAGALAGETDSADALARQHVAFGDGHPIGFAFDEFDAARGATRVAAARVEAEGRRKATATAEEILASAREAAARERARMLAELKREVGRLVVQTAAAVTGRILTEEDQRRLTEDTARRLVA